MTVTEQVYTGKARLRARDIRAVLKNKVDPTLLETLETLAEQDGTLRQQIDMLANLVNKQMDEVIKLTQIIGAIRDDPNLFRVADAQKNVSDVALGRIKIMGEDEAGSS